MRPAKIIAVVCGSLFLFVVGTVLAAPALFFMSAAVSGTVVASYVVSRLALTSLALDSKAVLAGHEGTTVTVPLSVRNEGRLPRFLVTLDLRLPEGLACESEQVERFVALIPAGGRWAAEVTVRLVRRGEYHLSDIRLAAIDPLGMFGSSRRLEAPMQILVYPRLVPLATVRLAGATEPETAEARRSAVAAAGDEFYGVREYVPGDELRRIHWKSTARHGRFHVVEFDQPTAHGVSVILDASANTEAGDEGDTTFEFACRLAASLLHKAHELGNPAKLLLPPDTQRSAGPEGAGPGRPGSGDWFHSALVELARVKPEAPLPLDEAVRPFLPFLDRWGHHVLLGSSLSERLDPTTRALLESVDSLTVVVFDAASFGHSGTAQASAALAGKLRQHGAEVVVVGRQDDLAHCLAGTRG